MDAIPLRFISRKTSTSLVAPSNFDVNLLKRSSILPTVECYRAHVFGLSHSVTGTPIHALSTPSALNVPGSGRVGTGSGSMSLVYGSAALGVIHDLSTNKQTFFSGIFIIHKDVYMCIYILIFKTEGVGRRGTGVNTGVYTNE
jgi:hypothetical protein